MIDDNPEASSRKRKSIFLAIIGLMAPIGLWIIHNFWDSEKKTSLPSEPPD